MIMKYTTIPPTPPVPLRFADLAPGDVFQFRGTHVEWGQSMFMKLVPQDSNKFTAVWLNDGLPCVVGSDSEVRRIPGEYRGEV